MVNLEILRKQPQPHTVGTAKDLSAVYACILDQNDDPNSTPVPNTEAANNNFAYLQACDMLKFWFACRTKSKVFHELARQVASTLVAEQVDPHQTLGDASGENEMFEIIHEVLEEQYGERVVGAPELKTWASGVKAVYWFESFVTEVKKKHAALLAAAQ